MGATIHQFSPKFRAMLALGKLGGVMSRRDDGTWSGSGREYHEPNAYGCVVPFVLIAGSIIGFGMFAVNLVERFV